MRLWRRWEAFWLAPEPALNVAAARAVFAAHALWILASRDLAAIAAAPDPFWQGVPESARWRYLIFRGAAGLEPWLQALASLLLVAFALGLRPRISGVGAALLLYHLAPLETLYWTAGPYQRGFTIAVPALLALACAGAEGWGLRLSRLFVAQVYFFAGYAKLVRVGLDWISADTLRGWLLVFNEQDQIAVFTRLGPWIAAHPSACLLAAVFAIALDLLFPLAVFARRARLILVPAALAMHAGILLAMNVAFLNVPQLLVFVDWDRLRDRWRRDV